MSGTERDRALGVVSSASAQNYLFGLMELTTEAIVSADEHQRIVLFNRGAEEMFGYAMAEVLGQPLNVLLPADTRTAHTATVDVVIGAGDSSRRMAERSPVRGRRKNGDEFEAQVSFSVLRLTQGSVATALVRDVSVLRAAERALRHSETRYRTLVDASPAGIVTLSIDGNILDSNPAFAAMLGSTTTAELTGQSFRRRLVNRDEWDRITSALATSQQYTFAEHSIRRHDGQTAQLLIKAIARPSEEGRVVIHGFALDVTERQRLEAAVHQSQQLDSIGRLAGGVAHDFNNLLSIIRMCAVFLSEDSSLSSAGRNDLAELERAALRASDLTAQLLAFGRRQVLRPRSVDLRKTVERIADLLGRLLGEDVVLRVRTCDAPAPVLIDEGQIERALVNLITNARDAMPTGGTAAVTVDLEEPSAADRARCPSLGSGPHVRLTVADSGVGMDDAMRAQVFEPFFSTKGVLKGTGLGLASVYGIVAQSGGGIIVDSVPGSGTAFHLWFPATEEAAPESRTGERKRTTLASFDLPYVVLLIEDDPGVRALIERLLRTQGITVLVASDGASALHLVASHVGPIDVVLSDIVLPGMSGQQVVDRIVERYADIRVLFMTGYSSEAVENHGKLRPGSELISKPFATEELLDRLAIGRKRAVIK